MLKYDIDAVRNINPLLAYLLEVVRPRWVPRVYKVDAVFNSGIAGQQIDTGLAKPMASDAWIYDLEYSIRVINQHPGALFKGFFDYYNERQPYLDMDLSFIGAGPTCDIRVTNAPTPIQHVARVTGGSGDRFTSAIGDYQLIWKDQDMRISMWLRQALADDDSPFVVTVVAKMYEIDRCHLCDVHDCSDFHTYCAKHKLVVAGV